MSDEGFVDLGWNRRLSRRFGLLRPGPDSTELMDVETFGTLLSTYRGVPGQLAGLTVGRYVLQSSAYISDLEDALRSGLVLFDKVIIEMPGESWDSIERGIWSEDGVSCEVSFLAPTALQAIADHFGDLISNELVLLPQLHVQWIEDASPYAVGDVLGPVSEVLTSLAHGVGFEMAWSVSGDLWSNSLGVPVFVGGDVRDIARLRRDEAESFGKWRHYLESALSSQNLSERDLTSAVEQGLAELDARLSTLKRKGVLDAIGAAMFSGSYATAAMVDGGAAITSGAIGLVGVAAAGLKAYYDANDARREMKRDDRYFYWVTQRVHRR